MFQKPNRTLISRTNSSFPVERFIRWQKLQRTFQALLWTVQRLLSRQSVATKVSVVDGFVVRFIIQTLTGACPRGGGGTPLYELYRYVPPQRVWFSSRFGLKTGVDFDHYGFKSCMVFKGTTGAYKRICLFNSKWIVEEEKYPKCIIRAEYYQLLTLLLMRSRNYGKTKVWKRVWILEARSENGCGKWHVLVWNWVRTDLGNRAAQPYRKFRGVPPPGGLPVCRYKDRGRGRDGRGLQSFSTLGVWVPTAETRTIE